tara:strand:+ start:202 stop:489 length:288 start_codon:yes stop_codon:yes gene_type:complete
MCLGNLFSPKIPKVKDQPPPPIPKKPPAPPDPVPEAKTLRDDDEKARVTYGTTKRDQLTSEGAQTESKSSIIPLNRSTLADPTRASQQGVGGTVE